jgi:putative tricarboxylic transport membrane protein
VRRRDVGSGLFWLAVGAFVAWSGWDLELGSVNDPGSGFMLFWVGLIIAGLSAAVVVGGLRGAGEAPAWAGADGTSARARWSKVLLLLVALAVYAWLLPRAGFIVTTTVVMVALFKFVEPQRWSVAIAGAIASALIAYVVFKVWLGAQLPAGELGFFG